MILLLETQETPLATRRERLVPWPENRSKRDMAMHMSIFEAYVQDVPFTAEQIAWIARHKQHMTALSLAYYRRHYDKYNAKRENAS